jgi:hypothetical protein
MSVMWGDLEGEMESRKGRCEWVDMKGAVVWGASGSEFGFCVPERRRLQRFSRELSEDSGKESLVFESLFMTDGACVGRSRSQCSSWTSEGGFCEWRQEGCVNAKTIGSIKKSSQIDPEERHFLLTEMEVL